MSNSIKLIECPRDALQGWKSNISTEKKINYLNSLLGVGFDTIDFGSFVSPKTIPQMADTKLVIPKLQLTNSSSKLLAIVANFRGANEAADFDEITYLGFPFSISETFQLRNTNSTILESLNTVEEIFNGCIKRKKQLVVYLSMSFGNPYEDPFDEEVVFYWADKFASMGIKTISLADTIGVASVEQITKLTSYLIKALPETEIGVHLHSSPTKWKEKFEAALNAGCKRFDGALKGFGGCPMATDQLIGNMPTELMIAQLENNTSFKSYNEKALTKSLLLANEIFHKEN